MNDPLVCAVMITNKRQKLAARASACFREQTYPHKRLFVLDSNVNDLLGETTVGNALIKYCMRRLPGYSIGALRNRANELAIEQFNPDILINWDDDDWSHPNRIASQVDSLLHIRIDGKKLEAVGYRDLLWWDSTKGEAWMYKNGSSRYCLGTSLCYWPETWKRNPFPDPAKVGGHDTGEWPENMRQWGFPSFVDGEPMIVGEYHGANGACQIKPDRPESWKRTPQWDERLCQRMAL